MVKSLNSKESMSFLSGLIFRMGNGLGSFSSWRMSGSTWFEYTWVSPQQCTKSPGLSPHTCAIMHVSREYDAMLKGTPRPMSHDRWYIWHESSPLAT